MISDTVDEPAEVDGDLLGRVESQLRKVLALAAELGDPISPATTALADDPTIASYQVATLGPFGALDRQHLLEASSAADRLVMAARLLDEQHELLTFRLRAQSDGGATDDDP